MKVSELIELLKGVPQDIEVDLGYTETLDLGVEEDTIQSAACLHVSDRSVTIGTTGFTEVALSKSYGKRVWEEGE